MEYLLHTGLKVAYLKFVRIYDQDPNYLTEASCPCTKTAVHWPHQIPSFINNNYCTVSPFQTTITSLSGFVDHYTSVAIITDIVAILLKCVTGSYDC